MIYKLLKSVLCLHINVINFMSSFLMVGHILTIVSLTLLITSEATNELMMQGNVIVKRTEDVVRGFDDFGSNTSDSSSDSSSDEDDVSHDHNSKPLPNTLTYKSLLTTINTSLVPEASAGTGHVISSKRHSEGKVREVATKPIMGTAHHKPPSVYTSYGNYLITDSLKGDGLKERGPILLDVLDGQNELIMAAFSTLSIPKLYPIVGFRKELPGIALPPPIHLDLPKVKDVKNARVTLHHDKMVKEKP